MTDRSDHLEGDLQHLLAEEGDVTEQGLTIQREEDIIVLRGEVLSGHRRDAILATIAEHFPDIEVRSELTVIPVGRPQGSEVVS
jgi:hypothetical protein